jgi:putative salt-induced outer membrane protein YdiY
VQAQSSAILTNPPPAKVVWASSISAGITLTRGNSDTTLANFAATTDRKTDNNELNLGASATYGKAKVTSGSTTIDSTTAQNADAFAQYNQLFTTRWYAYGRLEGLHDDVADLHYRITASPGVGYYFIKNKACNFSGEVGPGYVSQLLGSEHEDFATIRLADKFEYKVSDRARVWENAEIDPDTKNFGNYIITSEVGVEADMNSSKSLALQVYLDDDYESQPALGRLKNDAKLVGAVAFKF